MSGVREIDVMMARSPRAMRRAIATSPSRVSNGTVPISRRYLRTGSLVLSSAPAVRSSSSSSAPSAIERCLVPPVLLVRVDDLDARAAEGLEQLVELVGGGDVRRQQLVDLVVRQVAFFLVAGDQLPDLVVLFFDRHVRVLRCARGHPRSLTTGAVALRRDALRGEVELFDAVQSIVLWLHRASLSCPC